MSVVSRELVGGAEVWQRQNIHDTFRTLARTYVGMSGTKTMQQSVAQGRVGGATRTSQRPAVARSTGASRKSEREDGIWTTLLRQTAQSQNRNRDHGNAPGGNDGAPTKCSIIVLGGKPEEQRQFVRSLARPPPPTPLNHHNRGQVDNRARNKGEVTLRNKFAYGYGHVTLFSPPASVASRTSGAGAGGRAGGSRFGGLTDSEPLARLEVHTIDEPDAGYVPVLRRLLNKHSKRRRDGREDADEEIVRDGLDGLNGAAEQEDGPEKKRPSVVILMNWREPWRFLEQLRTWLCLLAEALEPPTQPSPPQNSHGSPSSQSRSSPPSGHSPHQSPTDPIAIIKAAELNMTVVLQNVEAQAELEREWRLSDSRVNSEERFDYVSQCLRTALLPLHPRAALVYTSSTAAGGLNSAGLVNSAGSGGLSEVQKVVLGSLGLDLAALSGELASRSGDGSTGVLPKHNVVDRMAVVVPAGWDSVGKIRLLAENFDPEGFLGGCVRDLAQSDRQRPTKATQSGTRRAIKDGEQADGGAAEDVFATTSNTSDGEDDNLLDDSAPSRPIQRRDDAKGGMPSAIRTYASLITDPNAHKNAKLKARPVVEVMTRDEQEFLAEMRQQMLENEKKERNDSSKRGERGSGAGSGGQQAAASAERYGKGVTRDGGEGGALNALGDVSFNVGGVSYNAVSAEDAINRLKLPPYGSSSPSPSPSALASAAGAEAGASSPSIARASTPANPRAAGRSSRPQHSSTPREGSEGSATPAPPSSNKVGGDFPSEDLEAYFASLAKKAGGGSTGGGSGRSTPTPAQRR